MLLLAWFTYVSVEIVTKVHEIEKFFLLLFYSFLSFFFFFLVTNFSFFLSLLSPYLVPSKIENRKSKINIESYKRERKKKKKNHESFFSMIMIYMWGFSGKWENAVVFWSGGRDGDELHWIEKRREGEGDERERMKREAKTEEKCVRKRERELWGLKSKQEKTEEEKSIYLYE